MNRSICILVLVFIACLVINGARADDKTDKSKDVPKTDDKIGKSKEGSKTDDEVVQREEEAIKLDGLNVAQMKELRDKAEKHTFQAEVSRMMKLIINSLYKNKEIFLRELISNASDALDKIRLLSLTDPNALSATEEMSIKIKVDKENRMLHVTDTGVGMTKADLISHLGTIARSGTSEFFNKMLESNTETQSELIGQFGVGFYSSFLVADKVVVTSKHNDDDQHIWESDAASFSVVKDPRGNTLKRGTQITLHIKEEANEHLEIGQLKELVKKYSQFMNFNIYMWTSRTEQVEEPIEEEKKDETTKTGDETEDEAKVEEVKEDKPKTKKVEKTTWDWELVNDTKPIWMRKLDDITEKEYKEFYKSVSKDVDEPLAQVHFKAEGEVTFNSILYIPKRSPHDMFQDYGKHKENIKLYVRRVFITDDFTTMMPKYLSFIRGIVDSDDLPLNVSRETLQQHKLLKVIQKKLVRKVLDMIKKLDNEKFMAFWKEFSTNIKLGVMEDQSNRTRLSKLLRFESSHDTTKPTTLAEYIERMKDKQESIYYMCGNGRAEVETSPFVERLLKKGFEVIYCTEAVDEYTIQSMPDYDGKKFQNVAKEGLTIDQGEAGKAKQEVYEKEFKPLTDWLKESGLKDQIEKAVVSQRLTKSPCALVASNYGWSGNMERIMKSQAYAKGNDPTQEYYATQKKTLEVNPRHPVVRELLKRVEADKDDSIAKHTALLLFETATLRSGFILKDQVGFAERIENILKKSLDLNVDEVPEDEGETEEPAVEDTQAEDDEEVDTKKKPTTKSGKKVVDEEHEEL